MTAPQQKVSFLLNGSLDEQQVEEMRGPIVQQNGSPNLSDQHNTRLSLERGTCARCPDQQPIGMALDAEAPAYAIVGNERHRNYVLYTTPDLGNRVVAEDGYELDGTGVIHDRFGDSHQNAYVPLQITRAGAIAGMRGTKYPDPSGESLPTDGIASSYNAESDELWVAWAQQGLATALGSGIPYPWAIYALSYDSDGTILTGPNPVVRTSTDPEKTLYHHVGLTSHGPYGTRLWFSEAHTDPAQSAVYYVSLAAEGTTTVIGPRVRPVANTPNVAVMFGVASDDDRYAYLGCNGTDATTGALYKIDVTTGAVVASVALPGAISTTIPIAQVAVTYKVVSGVPRVAAMFVSENITTAVYDANLVPVVAPVVRGVGDTGTWGPAYAQFISCPRTGIVGAVFAYSFVEGFGGMTKADEINENYTDTWIQPFDGSATLELDILYGAVLVDRGATWEVSADEMYPLLFVTPDWGHISNGLPGGYFETLDPQIVGYTMGPAARGGPAQLSPVARFGVVRGTVAPVYHAKLHWYPAGSSNPRIGRTALDHSYFIPYKKADQDTPGRYVRLSVVPESPAVINDRDGLAIVACALPAQWDGVETVEYGGPLTAPLLNVVEDDVPGELSIGSYGLTCIYEWRDAAGLLHRSMPCPTLLVEITEPDKALYVRAVLPLTMRNGQTQEPIQVVLYMTRAIGTSYHEIRFPMRANDDYVAMSIQEEPAETQPIIYSRGLIGEEIVPQPPPPLRDLAIVGSRAWGIDAEVPTRVVYSKLRVAGIGFEFFPAGEVIVPSSAGEVVALREMSGTLIIFAERGIFQVSDGGPNNIGQGGAFGPPYKLSDVGTHSRQSVIGTPQGILFLDNTGGFSMLSGGGVVQLPGARLEVGGVTGAFALEHGEEVCFIVGSMARVYNYALQRWSVWDLPSPPSLTAQSAITRDIGLLYAPGRGRTYTVDSRVLHPTALMRWETDWILLGGDFQDYVVLYDVLFNAYAMGPHALRLELLTEYDGVTATTVREWTAAELALIVGPTQRYTVRVEPVRQDARAVKIRIQELTYASPFPLPGGPGGALGVVVHSGCRPGAVTIVYSVDGLTYEESNIPGSQK